MFPLAFRASNSLWRGNPNDKGGTTNAAPPFKFRYVSPQRGLGSILPCPSIERMNPQSKDLCMNPRLRGDDKFSLVIQALIIVHQDLRDFGARKLFGRRFTIAEHFAHCGAR